MRIISGKFRGRRLKSPQGSSLRPTADRLKETLFDILGPAVAGSSFLDVFAGSGNIGLEALSRHAASVVFVESDPAAVRLIRQNLALCGVAEGCRFIQQEAFSALRRLGREKAHADFIFMDPPYLFEPYGDLLKILFQTGIAGDRSICIIEHHAKANLPESTTESRRFRQVSQSDKRLSFYRRPMTEEGS